MSDERINNGDIVWVNFNTQAFTLVRRGEVLHQPAGTGDSWIIKDLDNGSLHYISEPCTITKLAN